MLDATTTGASRLPDPPPLPARLPCGLTREQVHAWALPLRSLDPAAQVEATTAEIAATGALLAHLRGVRERQAASWFIDGGTGLAIAEAMGISDSLVSRMVRKLGLPARKPHRVSSGGRKPLGDDSVTTGPDR